MVCHDSVHILELTSHDLVISGPNPMSLALEIHMVMLANDSFVAGQGADHMEGRAPKSSHKCMSCKGMELDTGPDQMTK